MDSAAAYKNKVEPLCFALKLILGILCLIISMILIIHLFLYILLKVNGKSIKPFINTILENIENSNASFFATVLFAFIGYYFMFCAIKGNVKLGLRFFCFTFYPMV